MSVLLVVSVLRRGIIKLMVEYLHYEIDIILVLFLGFVDDIIKLFLRQVYLRLFVENNDIDLHDITIKDVPAGLLLAIVVCLLHAYKSLARQDEGVALKCVDFLDSLRHEHVQVNVVEYLECDCLLLVVRLKLHSEAYEAGWSHLSHRFVLVLLEKFVSVVDN